MPQIIGGTDQAGRSPARHWGRFDGTPRGNGEIAAAGRRAYAMVQSAGLRWGEVIAPPVVPIPQQPYRPPRRWRRPVSPSDSAALCLQWGEAMTDWETDFCRSLIGGKHRISPRQSEVLTRITDTVEAFARSSGENSQ
jgi:hypothetical protein